MRKKEVVRGAQMDRGVCVWRERGEAERWRENVDGGEGKEARAIYNKGEREESECEKDRRRKAERLESRTVRRKLTLLSVCAGLLT